MSEYTAESDLVHRISKAPTYWEGSKQDAATGYCNGWNDCADFVEKNITQVQAARVDEAMVERALTAFNLFPCPAGGSIARGWYADQMCAAIEAALAQNAQGEAAPAEDRFEKYVATLITKNPDVRELGERLSRWLDEDQFNNIEPVLLGIARSLHAERAAVPEWLGAPLLSWALGTIDELNGGPLTADDWAEDAGLYQQARSFLDAAPQPAQEGGE